MRPDSLVVPFNPGSGPLYDVYGRLRVNDVLLEDQLGVNPLLAASWSAAVDALAASGTITLALGSGTGSTSPHMASSILRAFDCEPRAGRSFALETATMPKGTPPGGDDWRTVFDGEIDGTDVSGEGTVLTCRDGMCKALDRQIEPGTEYGFAVTSDTMLGAMEQIRDYVEIYAPDVGDAAYPLVSIGDDPEWTVVDFYQQSGMNLAEAWQRIVLQRGWAIAWRYALDSGRRACATVYDPERADQESAFPFSHGDIIRFARFSTDRTEVRNFIALQWGADREVSTTAGDGSSILKYGRRYMLFSEDATSEIDTLTEANRLLAAAHRDQSEPTHLVDYERFYFWPVELGDNQTLAPDNVRHDTPLSLNVAGFSHSLDFRPNGQFRTTIRTLGTSVAARRRWRQTQPKLVHVKTIEPVGFAPENAIWGQYAP